MTCEHVSDLILFYPGTRLSAEERRLVVAHTATCAHCRAELVQTLAVASQVRQQADAAPELPKSLLNRLPAQITALPQEQTARSAGSPQQAPGRREASIGHQVLDLLLPGVANLVRNPLSVLPAPAATWLTTTV